MVSKANPGTDKDSRNVCYGKLFFLTRLPLRGISRISRITRSSMTENQQVKAISTTNFHQSSRIVLAALEWGLYHTEARRHGGLSPVSWVRRSRSTGDLRGLCQGRLIESKIPRGQDRAQAHPTPTFVNGLVLTT
jgi:hypothetical protein